MWKINLIMILIMMSGCGDKQWRLGGDPYNINTIERRDKERDKHLKYRLDHRWDTTKHYVKQHKKKDGKINIFKRDGFEF